MLEAKAISRHLPGQPSFLYRAVSLRLNAGERLALVGPSGSGKTLVLRALAMLDPIDEGVIEWCGQQILPAAVPAYRQRVIYLQQRPAMLPGSVVENFTAPFRFAASAGKSYNQARVLAWLERLGRTAAFLVKSSRDLSGGEGQIMALVRALQLDPQVLLLDEATSALDPDTAAAFAEVVDAWVKEAAAAPRAVVWVTHAATGRERLADRMVHLALGQLREHGG